MAICDAAADRQGGLSFWLLLVLYPLALPLGTYPVMIGGVSVSAEFLFSLLCAVVVGVETMAGRLKVAAGNPYFLLGLALWLGANVVSLEVHPELGTRDMVFRMLLKALLGYMVFWVLQGNGRVGVLLKSYLVGCALSGLATIAFAVEAGGLQEVRQAAYIASDANTWDINIFRGFARAGAGNVLPIWICVVLYPGVAKQWQRTGLLALIVYFTALAMLALRREVLVEAVVGLVVLWIAMPRRFRPFLVVAGLALVGVLIGSIALSETWQGRLAGETRDEYEAGTDPRTVMLLKTPAELMEEPLLGHGPGSYPLVMTKHLPTELDAVFPAGIGAHNSFSRVAVESGMVGLSGFCLMVAVLGWRAVRRHSELARSGFDLRLAAVMIFLHVGDWLFFGDGISTNTTWYFVGVLLYLEPRQSSERNHSIRQPRERGRLREEDMSGRREGRIPQQQVARQRG